MVKVPTQSRHQLELVLLKQTELNTPTVVGTLEARKCFYKQIRLNLLRYSPLLILPYPYQIQRFFSCLFIGLLFPADKNTVWPGGGERK